MNTDSKKNTGEFWCWTSTRRQHSNRTYRARLRHHSWVVILEWAYAAHIRKGALRNRRKIKEMFIKISRPYKIITNQRRFRSKSNENTYKTKTKIQIARFEEITTITKESEDWFSLNLLHEGTWNESWSTLYQSCINLSKKPSGSKEI